MLTRSASPRHIVRVLTLTIVAAIGCDEPRVPSLAPDGGDGLDGSPPGDSREGVSPAGDAAPDAPAPSSFEEPIRVVFKIHIEPQSTMTAYAQRRDAVEAVRELAEGYGAELTLHGNGEFWQYAAEAGDHTMVRDWIASGHDVGLHMHAVHEAPDGSHAWPDATPEEQADEAFVRALWEDHHGYLAALVPELAIDQATPYNSLDAGYVDMMADYGYGVSGGGRHEISEAWFGHPPFFPWGLGARYLEEDLRSPVLMVHHFAQLGEAKHHGPPGGRVFQDNTVAHMQVSFLQVYLNRLAAERSGQRDDRIWMWGFLTHDNQSDPARRLEIDALLGWLTVHFGGGRRSFAGNTILDFASFSEVRDAYLAWEDEHPGVSSSHVETPTPIDPSDMTRIDDAESRRVYPWSMWGLARMLSADAETVVDFVRFDASIPGVEIAELSTGSRADATARRPRWLVWREAPGDVTVDLRAVVGAATALRYDERTAVSGRVDLAAVTVGEGVLILERER